MKIKLFTHNDLDGKACYHLLKLQYPNYSINVTYLRTEECDNKIVDFFESNKYKKYDLLFITDTSPLLNGAKLIDKYRDRFINNIILIDHHETALWLDKYDWATVIIKTDNIKTCGTSLLYDLLPKTKELDKYVETVRQYDTYDWRKTNNIKAYELNQLFNLIGGKRFDEYILKNMNEDLYKELIEIDNYKKEIYLSNIKFNSVVYKDYNIAITFAENYINDIADYILDNYEYDLVIIINMHKQRISYRSDKENLLEFYKLIGHDAGGHVNSGGSKLIKDIVKLGMGAIL